MDREALRILSEIGPVIGRLQASFGPAVRIANAIYGRPNQTQARDVWSDPSVSPAFKAWLKKRLTDPHFRSRLHRFQSSPCAENYKPEIAAVYLYLTDHSSVGLKDRLKEMHKRFVGQKMDRANLHRLLRRLGL